MFLEQAFLGAVRFGYPTVESVARVFETLFAGCGQHLYRGAGLTQALDAQLLLNRKRGQPRRSLIDALDAWANPDVAVVVQLVNASFGALSEGFSDPVDFFRRVSQLLASQRGERFQFPLTRGPAHGDLHGRNVLVGVRDDTAERPAVYDYEHMAADNLIGLDFAKLETELKIRAYRYVFPFPWPFPDLPPQDFIRNIQHLEQQLTGPSDTYHPRTGTAATAPEERLFWLLRALRRQAARYLGAAGDNPDNWNREYLLLLAAYGVYTVRFPQANAERIAAYVSAGVAAHRLLRIPA